MKVLNYVDEEYKCNSCNKYVSNRSSCGEFIFQFKNEFYCQNCVCYCEICDYKTFIFEDGEEPFCDHFICYECITRCNKCNHPYCKYCNILTCNCIISILQKYIIKDLAEIIMEYAYEYTEYHTDFDITLTNSDSDSNNK